MITIPTRLKALAARQGFATAGRCAERLRTEEPRFRALVEKSHDAIVVLDGDGRRTYVSQSTERILGVRPEELVGRSAFDIVHPDDVARARAFFADVKGRPGASLEFELRCVRQDGAICWLDMTATNLLHVQSVQGVVLNYHEVTERKLAEEALRQSEARLRILVQTIPDLVWLKDSNGTYLSCNPAFERLYGAPEASIVGRTDYDFVEKSLADFFRQHDQAAMAAGVPTSNEEWLIFAHDGYRGLFQTIKTPMHDQKGKLIGVLGVARDITERKQAAEALQQSEERYRQLFENSPLPMWLFDLETMRFLAVNESAVQHYGYTREEFLGMTVKNIRSEAEIPALQKAIAEMDTEGRSTGTARHQRKDGTVIQVEFFLRALVFEGRRTGLVLANDVTEKKLLEEKFLHAQRLESLGMLAAGVAHDFNNVLAPILFAAPLLRNSVSSPRDIKILDILLRSGERGAGLVKLILGFAQSATGEPQLTQLKHIARDVICLVEETFPKSIQLEHQIPSDTWPILCNPTQLHQVLLNLCVNARDAMPQGGTLHIRAVNRQLNTEEAIAIPGARPGNWLTFEVTDTGTGIPPEVVQRIWEPFFTTKGAGKGTGLGLATVRGIVASHNGFIELQTVVGHGTTFRVFLPAAESDSAAAGFQPFAVPEGHGEHVLVVDDDKAVRDVVAATLRRHNYRVLCCNDGVEAFELFTANPNKFALVITDIDMPNLGGVELTRLLMHLRSDLHILTMSGLSPSAGERVSTPEDGKQGGAFLQKPFKFEDLLGAVGRLLHPSEQT